MQQIGFEVTYKGISIGEYLSACRAWSSRASCMTGEVRTSKAIYPAEFVFICIISVNLY